MQKLYAQLVFAYNKAQQVFVFIKIDTSVKEVTVLWFFF